MRPFQEKKVAVFALNKDENYGEHFGWLTKIKKKNYFFWVKK